MTDAPAPPPDDDSDLALPRAGIDLRENGTVRVWVDGRCVRLRRPKAREFREVTDALNEAIEEQSELINETARQGEAIRLRTEERIEQGEAGISEEDAALDRKIGREMNDRIDEIIVGWWLRLFSTLGAPDPGFEAADLPPWLTRVATALSVIGHWRSVPSLSGSR